MALFEGIHPGVLEVFCGPMKSGKSRILHFRLDSLNYTPNCEYKVFQPNINTRDEGSSSRFGSTVQDCISIDEKDPRSLADYLTPETGLVAIEEVHFFDPSIVGVVKGLLRARLNVIVAGLDLDFRGDPFETTKELLVRADYVRKMQAKCDYQGCGMGATRTQKLINGEPAPYNAPVISVEGAKQEEAYEVRCLQHHIVPDRPEGLQLRYTFFNADGAGGSASQKSKAGSGRRGAKKKK